MSDHQPQSGQPGSSEILESGGGEPARAPRRGRRTAVIGAAALTGVVAVGGAAWAATWYLSSGASASEALPDTTLGYVSLSIDPSGEQLLAARETMEKFPAWTDEEISSQDDLRRWLFEEATANADCPDLDYEDDVESWLGDRVAFAGVDTGEDEPVPVGVLEVTDEAAAEDGLAALRDCAAEEGGMDGSDATSDGGWEWVVSGGWVYVAETAEIAEDVVAATEDAPLSDDEDHQRVLEKAGEAGIMTMYAAPEVGDYVIEALEGMSAEDMGSEGMDGMDGMEGMEGMLGQDYLDTVREAYEDFGGAAAHVRFADGSVEMEFAGEMGPQEWAETFDHDRGDDAVADLPGDTAMAMGVGFDEGWLDLMLDQVSGTFGMSPDEVSAEVEQVTGLSTEEIEALLGESLSVGVAGTPDREAITNSGDFSSIQFAVKVKGDPEAVEDALDQVRTQVGPEADALLSRSEGDFVVVGIDEASLDAFAEDGDLAEQEDYQDVLPDSEEAAMVLYANADAGDDWLVRTLEQSGASEEEIENVRPLAALGIAGWYDDGVSHGRMVLTTD